MNRLRRWWITPTGYEYSSPKQDYIELLQGALLLVWIPCALLIAFTPLAMLAATINAIYQRSK